MISSMNTSTPSTTPTEQVWREFRSELLAFIRRRVPQAADAEDVLQKVFLNLHRHLSEQAPPEHLRGWLYQVTRNAVTDHLRSKRDAAPSADSMAVESVARLDHDAGDDVAGHLSRCMAGMVGTLAPEYRDALTWTELEGSTQAEAAERAGLSLSGMKSRVQRGREQLRDALLACCRVELDRQNNDAACDRNSASINA